MGSAVRGKANTNERALLEAIRLGRGPELIEILVGVASEENLAMRRAASASAVRHGHAIAAEILVRQGADDADVSPVDRLIGACVTGDPLPPTCAFRDDDHRMLSWAVRNRHLEAVPRMLAVGLDPNVPDRDGETPLHLAVRALQYATIEVLLAAGAAINARNFDVKTPLDCALARGDEGLARRLIEMGGIPAEATRRADLPQLFERAADAVAFGDREGLRELLDQEPMLVRARSPRPHRATLLHYCAANGSEWPRQRTPSNAPEIAQLLLDRGADVDAVCKIYGGAETTMRLLLSSSIPRDAGLDGELVRVLARGGAKLVGVDGDGPMTWAIRAGLLRAAAALADAGVPLDNPLYAAALDRVDVLERLLLAGSDVNARDGAYGLTALHAAATMGHARAVNFLLAHGANRTLRETQRNHTALDLARFFAAHGGLLEPGAAHREIVQILEGRRAP
jgi:ankyrin repeat protein